MSFLGFIDSLQDVRQKYSNAASNANTFEWLFAKTGNYQFISVSVLFQKEKKKTETPKQSAKKKEKPEKKAKPEKTKTKKSEPKHEKEKKKHIIEDSDEEVSVSSTMVRHDLSWYHAFLPCIYYGMLCFTNMILIYSR